MPRKGKKRKRKDVESPEFSHNPFSSLKGVEFEKSRGKPSKPDRETELKADIREIRNVETEDEDNLFVRAMQDVEEFEDKGSVPEKPIPQVFQEDDDMEVQRELVKLVNGQLPFEISDSDEYMEGRIRGLPELVLKRLRRGEYSMQDKLDLHGMTRVEARKALEEFIFDSRAKGLRGVLVIHGRGMHSDGQNPILKNSVRAWFERGRGSIGGSVLAFTSARPADGGLGAMYVLLRRRKQKV